MRPSEKDVSTPQVLLSTGRPTLTPTLRRKNRIEHKKSKNVGRNQDRGRRVIPADPFPHHRTCGSEFGGPRSSVLAAALARVHSTFDPWSTHLIAGDVRCTDPGLLDGWAA